MELFYYTTTDTMKYILTQGDIYATNIRYMNDSEEYINGLKEIYELVNKTELVTKWINQKGFDRNLLKKMHDIFSHDNLDENMRNMEYYSISFCKQNDLLSQWAIYAKEAGVSIKMNFENSPYKFLSDSCDEDKTNKAEWNLMPQEVYYFTYDSMEDKSAYEEIAYKILDQLYEGDVKDQSDGKKERWRYVSTLVKRYDFYQEKESRLIFDPNETAYIPSVLYRQDKKVLKPYLDIYCDNGWPIIEVMIGPGFNQQVVFDSVQHLLDHAKVKVGITSVEDYVERVKLYLSPYDSELKKYSVYDGLSSQCLQEDWVNNVEMEQAKIFINQEMFKLREEINKDDHCNENLKKYFKKSYFTRSGVVLTKSSIPYIF